jgi:hypothetical protein
MFKRLSLSIAPLVLVAALLPLSALAAEQPNSLQQAINQGEVDIKFRYRYEHVDQATLANQAHASTLKSRFSYSSGSFYDFSLGLEVDNVVAIGTDNYHDFSNGMTAYPVVADPEGTDINQAWVGYSGLKDTLVSYGRQRINLDNQRFVGAVGWRQNEQTYDALTVVNTAVADTRISYSYLSNINPIFGPDDGLKPADLDSKSHILNIHYQGLPIGKLTAYSYWLDVKDAPPASSHTSGLRLTGKAKAAKVTYNYSAEYARQSDYGSNTTDFDADYYVVELGLVGNGLSAKLGLEVLEGDSSRPGQSFRTPLATLHKFNGWADQFLNTPAAGLEDRYIHLGVKVADIALKAVYHQFDAQNGGADYGSEWNFSAAQKVCEHTEVLLKYANFDADDFGVDVEKVWLQLVWEL